MFERFNTRTRTGSDFKISLNLKKATFKVNVSQRHKACRFLACHINGLFHNVKTGALANELVPYSWDKSPNATLVDGRINYFIETLAREFERTKENRGQYFCLAIICIL